MSIENVFQLLGLTYTVIGIAILLHPKYYKSMIADFIKSPAIVFLNAFIVLAMGYLLLLVNNEWEAGAPVIITIIGWLALIKGLFILLLPKLYLQFAGLVKVKYLRFEAVIAIILGLCLLYLGFV
jgi:hypothetical protein